MSKHAFVLVLLLAGCKVKEAGLTILVTADDEALVRDGLAFIADERIHTKIVSSPEKDLSSREGVVVALSSNDACDQCYRLEGSGTLLQVRGGGPLGRQYGLWHALEALGYRFPHPRYTRRPGEFLAADPSVLNRDYAPEMKKRRGLHLHTLHPIETLYDFWIPSKENLEGGKRAIDFLIKNRGNYLQWCALDDIDKNPALRPAWAAHTKQLTDFAHAHGVHTGVALQLGFCSTAAAGPVSAPAATGLGDGTSSSFASRSTSRSTWTGAALCCGAAAPACWTSRGLGAMACAASVFTVRAARNAAITTAAVISAHEYRCSTCSMEAAMSKGHATPPLAPSEPAGRPDGAPATT